MSKRKAGDFSATCKIGGTGNDRELTFDNAKAFEEHLLAAHGARLGQTIKARSRKPGVALAAPSWVGMACKQVRTGFGLWKAPKLTEDGKPFQPLDLAPGAEVSWKQGDARIGTEIARTGQVWCAGSTPRSVWVIPFDRFEGETAIQLEQLHSGELSFYAYAPRSKAASA